MSMGTDVSLALAEDRRYAGVRYATTGLPLSLGVHLMALLGILSFGLLTITAIEPPDAARRITGPSSPPPITFEFRDIGGGSPPARIKKGSRTGEKDRTFLVVPPTSQRSEDVTASPVHEDESTATAPPDQAALPADQGSGDEVSYGDPLGDPLGSSEGILEGGGTGRGGSGSGVGRGPGSGESEGEILDGRLHPPRLIRKVEPTYPSAAMAAHLEGVVLLEVVIGAEGTVTDIRVVKPCSFLLDRAAIEAIRQWRYEPARVDGRLVAVYLKVEVSFRLR